MFLSPNNYKLKTNNSSAFTLIELLIVIAIIGILSAMVLVSLNTAKTKAKDVKVKNAIVQIRNMANIYMTNNGSFGGLGYCGSKFQTPGVYPTNPLATRWKGCSFPEWYGANSDIDASKQKISALSADILKQLGLTTPNDGFYFGSATSNGGKSAAIITWLPSSQTGTFSNARKAICYDTDGGIKEYSNGMYTSGITGTTCTVAGNPVWDSNQRVADDGYACGAWFAGKCL